MRRITFAVMSTISALVVLFSYHTSTNSPSADATPEDTPATTAPATTGSATTGSGAAKTYTGESADTQWGPVQVAITVEGKKITKAEAVVYPTNNGRDQQINAYAVPQLDSEVVKAQSADIDSVSGATVTSGGYLQSLQSALDQANL